MSLTQIQALIKPIAQDRNLGLQVNQAETQLTVVINRPSGSAEINYAKISEEMLSKLELAGVDGISIIKFYGREVGKKKPEWQISHDLNPSKSSAIEKVKSKSQKTSQKASPASPVAWLSYLGLTQGLVSMLALLGIFSLMLFNSLAGQKTQTVVWEYKVDSVPDLIFTEYMDNLGEEGWELVTARRANNSITDEFSYECIFKRPAQ